MARFAAMAIGLTQSFLATVAVAQNSHVTSGIEVDPERHAYYGDLHLHTSYSADAYLLYGTTVDPDEAYRFARGEVVDYLGQSVQREEPLDFLAITDHAEEIGVFTELDSPGSTVSRTTLGKKLRADLATAVTGTLRKILWPATSVDVESEWDSAAKPASASAWQRYIGIANRYYVPGRFTTFIAYEWTSTPDGNNLHRNVIFRGDSAPYPFTSADSEKTEDLWLWLETLRKRGVEALAIPHNGNRSNGLMYDWVDSNGRPIDQAYAQSRAANEPLTEISQLKGSSETHPSLSPNDEFGNFEILDQIGIPGTLSRPSGSYVRDALSRGLVIQRRIGANPYKYGFVAGSDFHTGLSVSDPSSHYGHEGHVGLGGGRPTKDQAAGALGERSRDAGIVFDIPMLKTMSGNLTGVWAESNTRESIYDALRRKETFATSGTRVKFRFFGGWELGRHLIEQKDWVATAYRTGVPMGSDLPREPTGVKAPSFAIWTIKDPNGANLDRVQVIKVWEENGQQKERVFDVIWSGKRTLDPITGRLPAIGDTVDLTTGSYSNSIGSVELKGSWKDPEFDPRYFAAYYLRVLEIPTPRWSTLLAIRNDLPLADGVPVTEQQRAWSSPIWYVPAK